MSRLSSPDSIPGRQFGLDWLRIGAFGLLIFYHIGMFFAPGDWPVKAPHPIEAISWPMLALQPWRLPLLFLVSGFASYMLLRKSGGVAAFLIARSHRLLLPLLFGMMFIVPPQAWIALIEGHGYDQGLLHFMFNDWLRFGPVADVTMPDVEHLWFLPYLWTYTFLLAAMVAFFPQSLAEKGQRLLDWLSRGLRLIWAPLLPLMFVRLALLFTVPEKHGLLHDWVSDALYFPAFLFGFLLAGKPELWQSVIRCRNLAALIAVIAYVVILAVELQFPDDIVRRPHAVQALMREAMIVMAWSTILALLGVAHDRLNRDHPARRWLSDAVFSFYLIHQTIIVVVGWWIRDSGLSQLSMFAILVVATFGGCWLFYTLGRYSGPLRPFLGLSPPKGRTPALITARA
jgi:hypothetical protein